MKNIITIILLFASFVVLGNDKMQEANALYGQSKFKEAAEIYESLLSANQESAELYFNLGNAYYRMEDYTKAVLNYERSLLLAPGDEAVEANLAIARLVVGDKLEEVPEFFLDSWFRMFYLSFATDTWAVLSMLFFAFFIVSLSLYFFSKNRPLRKIGFLVAAVTLFFTLSSVFLASKHHSYVNSHKHAIIYTPALTVVSAPNDQGSELFVIHEGTKVKITKELGDWREIKLSDGRVGWVKASEIIKI